MPTFVYEENGSMTQDIWSSGMFVHEMATRIRHISQWHLLKVWKEPRGFYFRQLMRCWTDIILSAKFKHATLHIEHLSQRRERLHFQHDCLASNLASCCPSCCRSLKFSLSPRIAHTRQENVEEVAHSRKLARVHLKLLRCVNYLQCLLKCTGWQFNRIKFIT